MKRVYNFNAGPAALPKQVLQRAQEELLDFQETGMSVMELSHRSKEYDKVHQKAATLLKELLQIPDNYDILFMQGGASLQFSAVPMNFLPIGKTANYSLSGSWSEKALKEAQKIGSTHIASTSKESGYTSIPYQLKLSTDAAYLHITSNNTIFGTQWTEFPTIPSHIPMIADMSSDILSRSINVEDFSLIYAGAQKNLGPSGVTVVIIKRGLLEQCPNDIPTMLNYQTHAKNSSLYNTPPTFSIYMLSLVLEWVAEQGGVEAIEKINQKKAELLYDTIDRSEGFYNGHAEKGSRSLMNVTFNLPSEELTSVFLTQAKEEGFVGLGGHRMVGGCRASIYNAVPLESCEALAEYMKSFQAKYR
ncbi:3-phosphoserine/phosphohydroxythreonine transaminase [Sutcliffiella horikoshii]|uniref:Phosphoserine aminotransferase n=1 Tax=Sutcliffiella horikoshii TaxID=79883 RepID=A0A5D4SSD8_9BACI|nr:3-phosphoserine/phosphohydroxythreonine transaminase [Sutcliffiella horikoshii]TYS65591.1 3-phosphoserine/phosphohydroxythreonine transaminase [Sutcliffiella horikoshii]